MTTGRTSKIVLLGLQDEVAQLRREGYSFKRLAEELKKRHPKISVTKDTIHRYWKGLTKKANKNIKIDLAVEISEVFEQIYHMVRISNLSSKEIMALVQYIKTKENRLKSYAYRTYRTADTPATTKEILVNTFTTFSNCLCKDCRERINEQIANEDE